MANPKSELQLAADRVRQMTLAVESSERDLKECEDLCSKARIVYEETSRDLSDTRDLLNARQCKLYREVETVRNIVGFGGPVPDSPHPY